MADEVRPLDPQVAHERAEVRRLLGDADRSRQPAAARVADPMVGQYAVPTGQGGFVQERCVPASEDSSVDEHNRLTVPSDVVLELDAVETSPTHGLCPFVGRGGVRRGDDHNKQRQCG